ncbi:MAG: HesA/MoeB/ThiF family protein [Deltaproteobacteria bacterium]|nr:HesA/MoeB/ThiF family protein [Deltaproteobacteria bacterium]
MNADAIKRIIQRAQPKKFPDKTAYNSISISHTDQLSKAMGVSSRQIEIMALEHGIVPERYARNMKTFGPQDQIALLNARVSIVGLGGLGGAVVEILARIGIGKLNVIDGDTFEESNLNRQFLSIPARMSKSKAEAAAQRIKTLNSAVEINAHPRFLDADNGVALLRHSDVCVDCLDNLKTRFTLERLCKQIGSPLVSAAVAGASGQVTTIFPEDQGLKLIYGAEEKVPPKGAETALGTVPYAVTFLAALECAEVIKIIQGKPGMLRNKLLVADLDDAVIDIVALC